MWAAGSGAAKQRPFPLSFMGWTFWGCPWVLSLPEGDVGFIQRATLLLSCCSRPGLLQDLPLLLRDPSLEDPSQGDPSQEIHSREIHPREIHPRGSIPGGSIPWEILPREIHPKEIHPLGDPSLGDPSLELHLGEIHPGEIHPRGIHPGVSKGSSALSLSLPSQPQALEGISALPQVWFFPNLQPHPSPPPKHPQTLILHVQLTSSPATLGFYSGMCTLVAGKITLIPLRK